MYLNIEAQVVSPTSPKLESWYDRQKAVYQKLEVYDPNKEFAYNEIRAETWEQSTEYTK